MIKTFRMKQKEFVSKSSIAHKNDDDEFDSLNSLRWQNVQYDSRW
jgi:hypothetical protein